MKINRHIHQTLRLKSFLVTLLLLTLLAAVAWLGNRYPARIDLSFNAGNTLSEVSAKVLAEFDDSVSIRAFIKEPTLRRQISQLLSRYRQIKPDIEVEFIDPDQAPEQAREYQIGQQGAVVIDSIRCPC